MIFDYCNNLQSYKRNMRVQILTAINMPIVVRFRVLTAPKKHLLGLLCSVVYRRFRGAYCLHNQGRDGSSKQL
jgi:hypothetical protein